MPNVANVHPIYKLIFLSSLWVCLSSLFEIQTIETTTVTTKTTKKYRLGFTSSQEETFSQPTVITRITTTASNRYNNSTSTQQQTQSISHVPDRSEQPTTNEISKNIATTITVAPAEKGFESHPDKDNSMVGRGLFRKCTSPEAAVPWPFHRENEAALELSSSSSPIASSLFNPHLKCGFGLDHDESGTKTRFIDYFETQVKQAIIRPILNEEKCHDLVVFGAAFGESYVQYMRDELEEGSDDEREWVVDPDLLLEKHGRCFFMFVSHTEPEQKPRPQKLGHYWLIPLREEYLPYQNARRNTKLIKYMGQSAFLNQLPEGGSSDTTSSSKDVSPSVIIWQDAKFFRNGFVYSIPRDYSTVLRPNRHESSASSAPPLDKTTISTLPCLSTTALPATKSAFGRPLQFVHSLGLAVSAYKRPRYKDHCQTIIDALGHRPDVTDNPQALVTQCETYMKFVVGHKYKEKLMQRRKLRQTQTEEEEEEIDALNFGLIDSAFLIWNESTQQCRDFNAALRCSMLDQLQCHSDRDQVVFPLIIHQLLAPNKASSGGIGENENLPAVLPDEDSPYALKAMYHNSYTEQYSSIDKHWKPHAHDWDLVDSNYSATSATMGDQQQVYVRMKRSACHWYYFEWARNQPIGERSCGHKIWLENNLKEKNPSLEQEIQIAIWSDPKSSELEDETTVMANVTQSSLTADRGHIDLIEAPFAADFHKCTSPEYDKVPWTFERNSEGNDGEEATLSCGTGKGKGSALHQKLQERIIDPKIRQLANEEMCTDSVIFSFNFKYEMNNIISILNGEQTKDPETYKQRQLEMQSNHGNCFFLFVLEENLPHKWKAGNNNTSSLLRGTGDPKNVSSAGLYWIITLDRDLLPYESMKRNSKFFRYSGQFFFSNAKNVIYQDITLFSKPYGDRQPTNYRNLYPHQASDSEPCLTVFSLPKNPASVGSSSVSYDDFFQEHCKHVINSMEKLSPDGAVTGISLDPARTKSLIQQCDAYIQFVYKRELSTDILNQGMIDTNFMSWNESTEFCRDFNAQLRCTILDQLHCHSENDKLVFPFALYVTQMGLGSTTEFEYTERNGSISRWPVNLEFEKKEHTLNFFRKVPTDDGAEKARKQDVAKIIPARRHWARKKTRGDDNQAEKQTNSRSRPIDSIWHRKTP